MDLSTDLLGAMFLYGCIINYEIKMASIGIREGSLAVTVVAFLTGAIIFGQKIDPNLFTKVIKVISPKKSVDSLHYKVGKECFEVKRLGRNLFVYSSLKNKFLGADFGGDGSLDRFIEPLTKEAYKEIYFIQRKYEENGLESFR